MMSFGWRPNTNCYGAVGSTDTQLSTATNGQLGCASPAWFWALFTAAVVGGLAAKKRTTA